MILQALDAGKEIRVVFFDISKAFDRVWHKGLLYKIEKNLELPENFYTGLKDTYQNENKKSL